MLFATFLLGASAITCPKDEVEVDGACYPETCVFDGTVCNNKGKCEDNACVCDFRYLLSDKGCYPTECVDTLSHLCSDHGTCVYDDQWKIYTCDCEEGFMGFGSSCVHPNCMKDDAVCSYYGECADDENGVPHCVCPYVTEGEYCERCSDVAVATADDRCVDPTCMTEQPDGTSLECNGHGYCFVPNVDDDHTWMCICDFGTFPMNSGLSCVSLMCISDTAKEEICSNHGVCLNDKCACDDDYTGDRCEYKKKDCGVDEEFVEGDCVAKTCISSDRDHNSPVCTGHGKCDDGVCQCDKGFTRVGTNDCVPESCINDGRLCPNGYCSIRGTSGQCVCNDGYYGFGGVCYPESCITKKFTHNPPLLCRDRGECDFDMGICKCDWLYGGIDCGDCGVHSKLLHGECVPDSCLSSVSPEPVMCRGHGNCFEDSYLGVHFCSCEQNYVSIDTDTCIHKNCMTQRPGGDDFGTECSGNGYCDNNAGACVCDPDFSGKHCEEKKCPSGQKYVYGEGCVSTRCITKYSDGQETVCGGLGDCVDGKCVCRGTSIPYAGACVSQACLNGNPDGPVCDGKGECVNGVCRGGK
ncbi:Tenascin-like protein [Giardia muris]|uniref:Tenascin-like protein n=1 Tax=Giardia muris TaxID=5742 RepID=A0A4Z1SV12_GIAMU|nr:Tenascin-like protein [Giardia muris]|eukprot:TNJ29722.1 Tenascin-like protein [Giardia muris]